MANYSARHYVEKNDLDGAYERYQTTYKNWKEHWFDACYEIYLTSKKWAKKYFVDPINKIITKISEKIQDVFNEQKKSSAYIVKAYDDRLNSYVTKVGKANNIYDRYKNDKHYTLDTIYEDYCFDSEDKALAMESVLRALFKKYFPKEFIEKDRFLISIDQVTDEMWNIIDKKIIEIEQIFAF